MAGVVGSVRCVKGAVFKDCLGQTNLASQRHRLVSRGPLDVRNQVDTELDLGSVTEIPCVDDRNVGRRFEIGTCLFQRSFGATNQIGKLFVLRTCSPARHAGVHHGDVALTRFTLELTRGFGQDGAVN